MNNEWNNENTAISVFGIVFAILGVILAIAIIVASLASSAHADELPTPPASPLEIGGGSPAAVVLSEPQAGDHPLQEGGWIVAFIVILLVIVVNAIVRHIRKK